MAYTVYRTQNIVNGRYYFGVHKTKNMDDRYLGSGAALKREIAEYGRQAFLKNVCFVFDALDDAFAKEIELVETYRADPLCYNLQRGGSGRFEWINLMGLRADNRNNPKRIEAVIRAMKARAGCKLQPLSLERKQKIRAKLQGRVVGNRTEETREKIRAANKGKMLSEETKEKIRKSQLEQRAKKGVRQ